MIFIKFQGLATGIHVSVIDNKGYLCLIKKKSKNGNLELVPSFFNKECPEYHEK